jgi:hypothetical protein
MRLLSVQHPEMDISSAAVVLSYVNTFERPLLVVARIEIGSSANPINGGSTYLVQARIDGVFVSPDSSVIMPHGRTRSMLQSRVASLSPGQTLEVLVTGNNLDTVVDVEAVLDDTTPATITDLVGEGSIPVDHNYGGTDELRIVSAPDVGVLDANITAFLKSDYDSGNRSHQYVRGRTTTNINGRWRNTLALAPEVYVLVISKPQVIVTYTHELDLTAED